MTSTGVDQPIDETAVETLLSEHYDKFARLQQQKLLMVSYLLERQAEIDDPITSTRSVLLTRHPFLATSDVDRVLRIAARGVSPDGPSPEPDAFRALLVECDEIIPGGYGAMCVVEYFQHVLEQKRERNGNADDLLASIFTGLIADFEAFMVRFLTTLYSDRPQLLASKDRTVGWGDVFGSVDVVDLRTELIDLAVIDILRGSFAEWMTKVSEDFKLPVAIYRNSEQITEMFQRRHILVHSGGQVSRPYMKNCPDTTANLGDHLRVDHQYLRQSAENLAVLALTLTASAMLQRTKAAEPKRKIEARTANWVYELLLRRRYEAVDLYLKTVPLDRLVDRFSIEIFRVNHWVALKQLGRFDECRKDVEQWQVAHLDEQFQLAKLALCDELQAAATLGADMREGGRLHIKHWVEWPLLEKVRAFEWESLKSQGSEGDA